MIPYPPFFVQCAGGGSGIPKLYVKFQWPLFFALKTRLFLANSDIIIPKCTEGGVQSTDLGYIPKKRLFCDLPISILLAFDTEPVICPACFGNYLS